MDKNKIIRRLQSAKHLLSGDDDRIDLDCCRLALGNIEEALEELEKSEEPVQKFIDVVASNRENVSIPLSSITAVCDWSGCYSCITTQDNSIYYCDRSRKEVTDLINRQ